MRVKGQGCNVQGLGLPETRGLSKRVVFWRKVVDDSTKSTSNLAKSAESDVRTFCFRKVDVRLHRKENSNSHGIRPVH